MKQLLISLGLILALAVSVEASDSGSDTASAATTTDTTPAATVESFHQALMASTRMEKEYDLRADFLGQNIDTVFDINRIARISAGRQWRSLDDRARAEYVGLVRAVIVGTWVSRFDADRGQQLVVLESQKVQPQRHVVRGQITRPSGDKVVLDYYLRKGKVFNVVADGVSDLSLRRADYASVIKSSKFAGLLEHLKNQQRSAREAFTTQSGGS